MERAHDSWSTVMRAREPAIKHKAMGPRREGQGSGAEGDAAIAPGGHGMATRGFGAHARFWGTCFREGLLDDPRGTLQGLSRDFSRGPLSGLSKRPSGDSSGTLYRDSLRTLSGLAGDPLGTLYRDFSGDSLGPSRGSLRDTRTLYRTLSGPSRDSPGTSL